MAPRPLAKPPVSLSRGDEVPHIFIRKSHQRARKILIRSGKRLLQQNLPIADSCTAQKSHSYPSPRWRAQAASVEDGGRAAFAVVPMSSLGKEPLYASSRAIYSATYSTVCDL